MSTAKQDKPIEAVSPPTGRLWAGVSVFAFGWILALTLVPFVTNSDFPTSVKATLTTLLVGLSVPSDHDDRRPGTREHAAEMASHGAPTHHRDGGQASGAD